MKIAFLVVTTLITVRANVSAPRLTGSIKSASGQPLAEVFIFPTRSLNDIAVTDDRGTFSLPRFETIIVFRREGFRPLTKIVESSMTQLDVVLEDAASRPVVTSKVCPDDKSERVGFTLRMSVPKEAIARSGRDVDYEDFAVAYGPKSESVLLSGIKGPFAVWAFLRTPGF
jgi:hypothetical protein